MLKPLLFLHSPIGLQFYNIKENIMHIDNFTFTFQIVSGDGTITIVEFESETWVDSFPKFLAVCRGSGFNIPEETALYVPPGSISPSVFADRNFLIFAEDLVKPSADEERPKPVSCKHSDCYYDKSRNM